jgi:hypothetical protein
MACMNLLYYLSCGVHDYLVCDIVMSMFIVNHGFMSL